jgi:hypothetical protein
MAEKGHPKDLVHELQPTQQQSTSIVKYEEEPDTAYVIGARTWLAIFALGLANCCAVISNTASFLHFALPSLN